MGALHSIIVTRTTEYCKPLSSFDQSHSPISKKRKLSSLFNGEDSIFSRISLRPGSKPGFSRDVHGPVRRSRSGPAKKVEGSVGLKERLSEKMGNCLGIQFSCDGVKGVAAKSFKFLWREKCLFDGREKEKLVIEIDDDEEEEENWINVSDDSSVEEIDVLGVSRSKWREGHKGVDYSRGGKKDFQSLDDVEKMMEVMVLDNELDSFGVLAHKKLYDLTKRRDGKLSDLDMEIEYNEKCRQRYQLLRSQTKKEQVKQDVVEECFVPLSEEEEALVAHTLSNFNRTEVWVGHENSNIDITGEKLQCLRPGAWLNDEVINLYLALLKEREKREHGKFLRCHFFNTFFYKKLTSGRGGYNFQAVRRWTTQRKLGYSLLDCEKIFVPIHKGNHWCLAIIHKKDEKFQYLDSLRGVDSQVLNVLARYYVDEVKDKCGKEIDVSSWEEEFVANLPEQQNGFDCGMFMIKYVDFYSRDIGLCFNQRDMPYFRRRTVKEILKQRAE